MGEGVDPTNMCQSLVQKVAQSKQLMAVTDPDILVLFENWLDELEEEVVMFLKNNPAAEAVDIASNLGISKSGAEFLLAKMEREGKI
ncbi:MAG: hypothetical protein P8130_09630 [Deltaproteobacteria bacterium]